MKQISTATITDSNSENIAVQGESAGLKPGALLFPKQQSIRNILAYSRALNVMESQLLGKIVLIQN